jgi:hypothetical protein
MAYQVPMSSPPLPSLSNTFKHTSEHRREKKRREEKRRGEKKRKKEGEKRMNE